MSHLILYLFSLFFTSVMPTQVARIPLTSELKADKTVRCCSSLFQDVSSDDDVSYPVKLSTYNAASTVYECRQIEEV